MCVRVWSVHGKFASWNFRIGFGQSLPLNVMVLARLYCSTSCWKKKASIRDCITPTRAKWSLLDIVMYGATKYIPMISWWHRDALDKSFSQTWGVRPGSSVSSADDLLDCRTCYRHLLRHDCHQSGEAHRHSWHSQFDVSSELVDKHYLTSIHVNGSVMLKKKIKKIP